MYVANVATVGVDGALLLTGEGLAHIRPEGFADPEDWKRLAVGHLIRYDVDPETGRLINAEIGHWRMEWVKGTR